MGHMIFFNLSFFKTFFFIKTFFFSIDLLFGLFPPSLNWFINKKKKPYANLCRSKIYIYNNIKTPEEKNIFLDIPKRAAKKHLSAKSLRIKRYKKNIIDKKEFSDDKNNYNATKNSVARAKKLP